MNVNFFAFKTNAAVLSEVWMVLQLFAAVIMNMDGWMNHDDDDKNTNDESDFCVPSTGIGAGTFLSL